MVRGVEIIIVVIEFLVKLEVVELVEFQLVVCRACRSTQIFESSAKIGEKSLKNRSAPECLSVTVFVLKGCENS